MERRKQLRLQIECNRLTDVLKLPHIKVIVFPNSNEKKGEYFYEQHWIKIYSNVCNIRRGWNSLKATLHHELAHYYQYFYFNELNHGKNFESILKKIISL